MEPLKVKIIFEFANQPSKENLYLLHDFMNSYPKDQFTKNSVWFINVLLQEIRKVNAMSPLCIKELGFIVDNFSIPMQLVMLILDEVTLYLQKCSVTKSHSAEDFSVLDIQLCEHAMQIFASALSLANKTSPLKPPSTIFSSASALPLLAYITSLALHCLASNRDRNLQLAALSVLRPLTSPVSSSTLKPDLIVNIAPGILQTLVTVVTADRKIGSSIKTKAIKCLADLVLLLFGRATCGVASCGLNMEGMDELAGCVSHRTEEWRVHAWSRVEKIVVLAHKAVLGRGDAQDEESDVVRMQWAQLCADWLQNCDCGDAVSLLVESLLTLAASPDPDDGVAKESKKLLAHIAQLPLTNSPDKTAVAATFSMVIRGQVRLNLHRVLSLGDRLATSLGDGERLGLLRTMLGYLSVCASERVGSPSTSQTRDAVRSLLSLCRVDITGVELLDPSEVNSQDVGGINDDCDLFRKTFVHFRDERILLLVRHICGCLVKLVNIHTLLSLTQSCAVDHPEMRLAALFLQKNIVLALLHSKSADAKNLRIVYRSLIETHFSTECMSLPTDVQETHQAQHEPPPFWAVNQTPALMSTNQQSQQLQVRKPPHATPEYLKHNTLLLALSMELAAVCGKCSVLCGDDDDSDDNDDSWMMRHCLYYVMSHAQHTPVVLRAAASRCLLIFATTKYSGMVAQLIRHNSDYLIDSVSRKLRRVVSIQSQPSLSTLTPAVVCACRCLSTLCRHADKFLLPVLEGVIDQLLYYLDQTRPGSWLQTLLLCLLTDIVAMAESWQTPWQPRQIFTGIVRKTRLAAVTGFLSKRRELLEAAGIRQPERPSAVSIGDDLDSSLATDNEDETLATAHGLEPEHNIVAESPIVVIVKKIVNRCVSLSSSSLSRTRVTCINTLHACFRVLSAQASSDILPVVIAQMWPALEMRFSDSQFPVVLAALSLLETLAEECGDFLYVKVRSGLVTRLCAVLETAATVSRCPVASARYTGLYRMQRSILCLLAQLIVKTDYPGQDVERVVDACLLYLCELQPLELCQAAESALVTLGREHDICMVWAKVTQLLTQVSISIDQPIYGAIGRQYTSAWMSPCQQLLRHLVSINDSA